MSTVKKALRASIGSLARKGKALKQIGPRGAASVVVDRRVARRSVSSLAFALADSIEFVNPAHWDALAAQTVFLSREYLRVLENHGPSNIAPRYAIAYESGRPVAAMLFQRVSVSGDRLQKPGSRRLIAKPLAGLREDLLVCGNLLVWGARAVAFAPDADASLLWRGVAEAAYRLRRSDKLLGQSDVAMVKDFCGSDEAARSTLRLLGYRSVDTQPDMVLTIRPEWSRHEDYLAGLTSSYRSGVKKLWKDCAAAGVTLRTVDAEEMASRATELHALYGQVHQAQSLRLATLSPAYLPAMARALGDRFICRVAERDGRWLGFVTTVRDGATAVGYYIGYDRDTNAAAPIYLSLLQSTVADAFTLKAQRLSLGRTALEPKAKMGCKPEPLACAVRHRLSAVNPIVSALVMTATHDEPPERSPFKAQP